MSIDAMKQALELANDIMRGKYKGNAAEISDALHLAIEQAERQEPPPEYQTEAEKRAYKFGFRKALHSKPADCLREMYELLQRCENEMRYAGWDKLEADNFAKNGVYEEVKELLEKNNG